MKWYYILFAVFFMGISVLTIYTAITPHIYSSNGIQFNYPGTWTVITPNQQSNDDGASTKYNVVAVGDPNSADTGNILVLIQKKNKSGTLDEIAEASKADLKKDWNATMLSDTVITVDGAQAHDIIYITDPKVNKKERMVILDKNNMVYCIILGCTVSAFDGQKNNFDMIINSFQVAAQ